VQSGGVKERWIYRFFPCTGSGLAGRPPEPSPAPEDGVGRKVLNFRLEPEVIYQLKLLALQERKPVQALLCEGVNEVFAKRGMERIAK
jgi:hypothetical protein